MLRGLARTVNNHLREHGKILFVISSLTNLDNVIKVFSWHGYRCSILREAKIPWETLYLIEAII